MKMRLSKNNKGFVLVESIVVAIFVLAFLTFLVVNLLPLIGTYENGLNYDTIESRYGAHLIRKMILKNSFCTSTSLLNMGTDTVYNHFIDDEMCEYLENKNYCHKLFSKEYLDVKEILITETTVQDMKTLARMEKSGAAGDQISYDNYVNNVSKAMRDYIKNMSTYPSLDSFEYLYQKRLIIRFGDNNITNVEIVVHDTGATCSYTCS